MFPSAQQKKKQILFLSAAALVAIIGGIRIVSNWMKDAQDSKPPGPYRSALSIAEAKKNGVWLGTFLPDSKVYFSLNQKDSFELGEIWMEKNRNDRKIFANASEYAYILNIYFNKLSKNQLHKFRYIPSEPFTLYDLVKEEHPDGYPRIRFLLHQNRDTIKIEVLERNPNDSLAWANEKSVDTIVLIKKHDSFSPMKNINSK